MGKVRARKKHVQLELPAAPTHGGKRKGAGRPAKQREGRWLEPHDKRPALRASQPIHVVTRVVRGLRSLRKRQMYDAIRDATIAIAKHEDCRIVHLSIQGTHLHLIVETRGGRSALTKGMRSFLISAAKQIHLAIRKRTGVRTRGRVFGDRYHETVLTTPPQVRRAIAYVLNNWRHHGEDQRGLARDWQMDPFSSAVLFDGWKERTGNPLVPPLPPRYRSLIVWFPKTWLLSTGWRRYGRISTHEVPKGKPHAASARNRK
jgi:REP element-mobilizing transposase RayT